MKPAAAEYQDFEIEIVPTEGGWYQATVPRAPAPPSGRTKAHRFLPPFATGDLERLLEQIESQIRYQRAARGMRRPPGTVSLPPKIDIAKAGRKMAKALLGPGIRDGFLVSQGRVLGESNSEESHRLQLRLTFRSTDDLAAISLIAAHPWELLLEGDRPLALQRGCTIVRSIGPRETFSSVDVDPLRVLIVTANPSDRLRLNAEGEEESVLASLEEDRRFETKTLHNVSARSALDGLLGERSHILHFIGHGGFLTDGSSSTTLDFVGDDGKAAPTSGSLLGPYLRDLPHLRLVVLNACWCGAFTREKGQDPFTGVATALIDQGVPAVVAMQQPISDGAAIQFSKTLYSRLAAGDSISAAVSEARLELWSRDRKGIEWATPVLFLRGSDRLFNLRAKPKRTKHSPKGDAPAPKQVKPTPRAPLFLRVQTFFPANFAGEDRLHDELNLTEFFEGPENRFIRSPSLWQTEIFPRLRDFLAQYTAMRCPLIFDFPAHMSVAFAAGYCLGTKSTLNIGLLQKSPAGVGSWEIKQADLGPSRLEPLWLEEKDIQLKGTTKNVALAVSVVGPILRHVEEYLKASRRSIGRIEPLTIAPKPSNTSVVDGRHALELAQGISFRARERSLAERKATLHLFAAIPNSLAFYLGQLGASLGKIQLYEHDFKSQRHCTYEPSLRLPLDGPKGKP